MEHSYNLSCEGFVATEPIRWVVDSVAHDLFERVPCAHGVAFFLKELNPSLFRALVRIKLPRGEVVASEVSQDLYQALRSARAVAIRASRKRLHRRGTRRHGPKMVHHRVDYWRAEDRV